MKHSAADKHLLDYLDGALGGGQREEVERHIESCDECRNELARMKSVRRAAALLRSKDGPSRDLDAEILSAARLAATRQRGLALEKEEKVRAPFWKFAFKPATVTTAFVVLLIGLAVFYLPHEQVLNEKEITGEKVAVTASPDQTPAPSNYAAESMPKKDELRDFRGNLKPVGNETNMVVEEDSRARGQLAKDTKKKAAGSDGHIAMNVPADKLKKAEAHSAESPRLAAGDDDEHRAAPAPATESMPASNVQQPGAPSIAGPPPLASTEPPPIVPERKPVCLPKAAGTGVSGSQPTGAPQTAPTASGGEGHLTNEPAAARAERKKVERQDAAADTAVEAEVVATKEMPAKQRVASNEAAFLMQRAKSLEQKQDWAAAAKVYSEILRKYPNYRRQEVLYHIGKCHASQKQFNRAQQYYDQLKKEYPTQNLLTPEEEQQNQQKAPPKKPKPK